MASRNKQDMEVFQLLQQNRTQREKKLFGYVKNSEGGGTNIEERFQGIFIRVKEFEDATQELDDFRKSLGTSALFNAGRQDA